MTLADLIKRVERARDDECIPWPGKTDTKGRGRTWVGSKIMLGHRAVWEAMRGPIPAGKLLCHTCDNAGCVNVRHMYVGTHADNMRDMKERQRYFYAKDPERCREAGRKGGQKNTWTRGAGNPKAKLTPEQRDIILQSGIGVREAARKFGVDRTTIQRVKRGSSWK